MCKSINGLLPDSLISKLKRTENVHSHNHINYNGYYISNIFNFWTNYSLAKNCREEFDKRITKLFNSTPVSCC